MNRQNNIPFNPAAKIQAAAPVYKQQQQPGRIPQDFRGATRHITVKPAGSKRPADMAAVSPPAQKSSVQSSAGKWKSSFKPVDKQDDSSHDNTHDNSAAGPERAELYDPYDPASSDSEHEMQQGRGHKAFLPDKDDILGHQHLSPSQDSKKKGCWDLPASDLESGSLNMCDFNPNTRPTESRGHSPGHRVPERQAYSPDTEPLATPCYGSISRPFDHSVCSPDRLIHGSSNQRFPASYGVQRTNEEESITVPEHRREVSPMSTTGRLSPHRQQRYYQHQLGYVETGPDRITPSTEATRNRSKNIILNKSPIVCDLCEVELATGQELQDHLESKSHWDTLEYIQQQNHYDDLAIAFLQEALLYKSRRCSRAIEDSVLQALQENDHMTKIEIFHCAACNLFVSSSAASVQTHITSQEHLANTKDFEVQQRRSCLHKANTMMKELKPQFEHFLKGGCPFE